MSDTTYDGLPPLPWQNEEFDHDFEAWIEVRCDIDVAKAFREYARAAVLAEREACANLAYNCAYKIPYDGGNGYQCIEVHTPKHAVRAIAAAIRARK